MKMPNLASVYQAGLGRASIDSQVGWKRLWPKARRPAASARGAAAQVRRRSRRRMAVMLSGCLSGVANAALGAVEFWHSLGGLRNRALRFQVAGDARVFG